MKLSRRSTNILASIIIFIIANAIIYVCGCFIALDMNPLTWEMFTTPWGRTGYALMVLIIIVILVIVDI